MKRIGIRLVTLALATFALGARASAPLEISLPIGKIFDQEDSQWCWAFSTFHTLRTYYFNHPSNEPWKKAVEKLNEPKSLRDFVGKFASPDQTGDPIRFVRLLRQEQALKSDGWTPFMPPGGTRIDSPDTDAAEVKILPREQIAKRIDAALEKGIPSAYCDVPHCVMIFGAKYENGAAKEYFIADSSGGGIFHIDAARIVKDLDYVLTRE